MAKNPMQRKAQNSFLLGMFITLLITGIVIALLVLQLTKVTEEQKKAEKNIKNAYVINTDINSGDVITIDKMEQRALDGNSVPADAITLNDITTLSQITDNDGNIVRKTNVISKISLKAGTIVTKEMIMQEGEITPDTRKVEYNMIVLPTQLETDKYVDIRLSLPSGKDFIVLSHKQIEIPTISGTESKNTLWLNMNETEILTLSCAIVESYKIPGSSLYITEYLEPGLQGAATPTYIPDDSTINLIDKDPNCLTEAKNALFERNNAQDKKSAVRNPINTELNNNAESSGENVTQKIEEAIKKTQEERQQYLESMGGSY